MASLLVQKFGGTSVGSAERIRSVAGRVARTKRAGNDVVVVISAMGNTTDELIALASQVAAKPDPRELDMLLTAGERISMALLAMAIRDQGVEAVSLTGSQAGILTDSVHGQAKIQSIRAERVEENLRDGKVVIVAGFQGVAPNTKDVTTLGRGGSDATAVALAAALGAEACEIYTDVDGVYTTDPRLIPEAVKLEEISFEEMLEFSAAGARVLMGRSVEFARRFDVPIHVRSSFHDRPGTWVRKETMEQAVVSGIAHDTTQAKLTVHRVADRPGIAARLFGALAEAGINVDLIVQNTSVDARTDISFTVGTDHASQAREICEDLVAELGAGGVDLDSGVAKISLIGAGMSSNPGIAARMFKVLASANINIEMISTSAIRISCVIRSDHLTEAVRALHQEFQPPLATVSEVGG